MVLEERGSRGERVEGWGWDEGLIGFSLPQPISLLFSRWLIRITQRSLLQRPTPIPIYPDTCLSLPLGTGLLTLPFSVQGLLLAKEKDT